MQIQRAKRFWKQASVVILDEDAQSGALGIALDNRPLRSPSKAPLRLRSRTLAEAIAAEWDAQDEVINPHSMPLTQLANTAQDRTGPLRAEIIQELMKYVDGDTLCYFAEQPQALVERQRAAWIPLLDWAEGTLGARWAVTSGIMPVGQPAEVHQALTDALATLNAEELAAYQVVAPLTASMVVAVALVRGRVNAEQAFTVALVDELYQAELWGEDWEAKDRWDRIREDLEAAERFLTLSRQV